MNNFLIKFKAGIAAPILLMLILAMIVIPLPPIVLDVLFVVNIVVALMVLMTCVYAKKPLDFSIFPTVLLIATMMRLSLNIASTRVILMNGGQGSGGAGQVIEAFGNFVIGGNFIVGLVVFLILTIINFVVITKGAERISEVGARFTLDSMPGKQMAVDADLNAGQINQEEASERRKEIGMESQFHGNMDGASKFVKGDAIAGMLILFVNIIGGLVIGIVQNDMSFKDALTTFTLLSIGDGLVAILPSIIMALATAIIITRVSSEEQLASMMYSQMFSTEMIPVVTGVIIFAIGCIPGMPNLLFLSMGAALASLGYYSFIQSEKEKDVEEKRVVAEQKRAKAEAMTKPKELSPDDLAPPPLVHIELGFVLSDIAKGQKSPLSNTLRRLQKELSMQCGILIKGIEISDSNELDSLEYKVSVSGIEHGRGKLATKLFFALPTEKGLMPIDGRPDIEPVFGISGQWIVEDKREEAEILGYEILTPSDIIGAHVEQAIKANLPLMVCLDDVQLMVDTLRKTKPKIVETALAMPHQLTTLLSLIRELLNERVPVKQLPLILETMAECADFNLSFNDLVMQVRKRLMPWILNSIFEDHRDIKVIAFSKSLQDKLNEGLRPDGVIVVEPNLLKNIEEELVSASRKLSDFDYPSVLFVSPNIRKGIFNLFAKRVEGLHVIDFNGLPSDTNIEVVSRIGE